jgi:hypothetical protein
MIDPRIAADASLEVWETRRLAEIARHMEMKMTMAGLPIPFEEASASRTA